MKTFWHSHRYPSLKNTLQEPEKIVQQRKGESPIIDPLHKNKVNLAKVMAAMNTTCPSCGYSITPAEVVRLDFERQKCPKCGAVFTAKAGPVRKTD